MRRAGLAALIALLAFSLVLGLRALGAIERLELLTLDARYALAIGRKAAGDDIVIAWIDQESMDFMDQNDVPFPWPREVYAQVLEHLRTAGARAVAFDILFDQRGNAADDRAFGEALAREAGAGDAVAMKFVNYRETGRNAAETDHFAAQSLALDPAPIGRPRERGLVLPIEEVAAGADRLGFVNIRADGDGTFRRYDLVRMWGRPGEDARPYPSLALATALAAAPGPLAWQPPNELRVATGSAIPCDRAARILLNLRGPAFSFANVKFVNILASINRVAEGQAPLYAADRFRDKIVLVGIHAEGYEDAHPTPLDAHLPGVELHATALDNVLRGDSLVVPEFELVAAAIAGALATAAVLLLPGVAWPALALALIAIIAAGAVLWAWACLLAVPVAAPMVAGTTATGAAFLWRLVVEGKQKREMHRAFRSYLAPEVLAEVLRDPSALRLGGESREVTLLFTDLQGFTALAERSEPQQLVAFLNDYFTRMCAPVLAERGIIDKFIGDAIMAMFGAPAHTPDHAERAVRAALRALATSEEIAGELRERRLPPITTRIGIHSGLAVIGNMGSTQRFDYTAVGDTVNLAARLEGANKAFGTHCLVSAPAWSPLGGAVVGREVGRVAVAGRSEPIRVYEPMALAAAAAEPLSSFVARWRDALALVAAGDRARAETVFAECAAMRPDDALTRLYRERLRDPAFDGVWRLDAK